MLGGVEAVAPERRQVDAADERDLVVDDHELLVVAMHRPLVGVERASDCCALDQPASGLTHLRAVRREHAHRRARPEQHSDLEPLGEIAEQITQPYRLRVAPQAEVRRDVPAGDVDLRARRFERLRDPCERLLAVDQQLHLAPLPGRRLAGRPQRAVIRGIELRAAAQAGKPAAVMGANAGLDCASHPVIHAGERRRQTAAGTADPIGLNLLIHTQSLPALRTPQTTEGPVPHVGRGLRYPLCGSALAPSWR